MHSDIERILISSEEIDLKCQELGAQISKDYEGKPLVLLGLLKGSVPFMGQLARYIDNDLVFDFMHVSSYAGVSSGQLLVKKDMEQDVAGRDVLIVEDIIDTGKTLLCVRELMEERGARSVKIVAMLDKVDCRVVDIQADYVGYDIPNAFVVGMGLDFDEKYRNLPYVGILKESVYK